MAIRQSSLRNYVTEGATYRSNSHLNLAEKTQNKTAFLCHSHKDEQLAKGLQGFLHEHGWRIYLDWEDIEMPDRPNKVTAMNIKKKIEKLNWFLFLATENSLASRWCPWEIGFADGIGKVDKIVVIQTKDSSGNIYGNEYLNLYKSLNDAKGGGYGVFGVDGRGQLLESMY